jgi:hypothetical protein
LHHIVAAYGAFVTYAAEVERMARDWHDWYGHYDDPTSSLSRRLGVVRDQLRLTLDAMTRPDSVEPRLISMCAGDGRDTLPVLASGHRAVRAVPVELDAQLSANARRAAADLGLDRVEVRTTDAGLTDAYAGAGPADVLLACGVFGNITDADVARTIAATPMLLAPGARVIWTRGRRAHDHDPSEVDGDPSEHVRGLFDAAGFDEIAFVRPDDAGFRVGVHRFTGPAERYAKGHRLFRFI